MNGRAGLLCLVVLLALSPLATAAAPAHELVTRETERGKVVGYKDTPLLPATGEVYYVHDPDRPVPKHVTAGRTGTEDQPGTAPSDAIVLFDGEDLGQWNESSWEVEDGCVVAGHGSLETKESFGDFQLHLEWMVPAAPPDHMMSRGNSGVMLMGQYEIQIFDSHPMHDVQIYPDGQAAAVYGQAPPLVNACRRPGQWQSYDVVFAAPEFDDNGKLVKRAAVTVFHNGVLAHLNQQIMGPAAHCRITPYRPHPARLPLALQGHGSPVRFRNVWIRPLDW
ncbi:MAG: 3-keto-disaccharide hydrolase [Planctomycetota bacterium]|jgi:hypothetical protein